MHILRNVFFQYGTNTVLNIGKPNAILIKNTGQVILYINNFPLAPNDVFTSNLLQADMMDDTKYNITFDPNGVGTKLVNVVATFVSEEKEVPHGPGC